MACCIPTLPTLCVPTHVLSYFSALTASITRVNNALKKGARLSTPLGPYYGLEPLQPSQSEGAMKGELCTSIGQEAFSARAIFNSEQRHGRMLPELLTLVMLELRDMVGHRWTETLLVCRYWFVVGATCSLLWTDIRVSRGDLGHLELCLLRANLQPLKITFDGSPSLLPYTFRGLHRVKDGCEACR